MANVLGIITARSGSKRIPKKNLRLLLGVPLIGHTLKAALESRLLTRVILSSDDDEIIEIARKQGVEVPFKRPSELAGDATPSRDVIVHAVEFMEKHSFFADIIVILQPTSPLRTADDIDKALKIHLETDADSVVSVVNSEHWHPVRAKKIEDDILCNYCLEENEAVRRQDLPPAYFRNGAFYSVKRDVLMNEGKLYGKITRPYVMPPQRSIDIDEEIDFNIAEIYLSESRGKVK
ncbi:cytidylyltransferase domain-containing protein [Chloroflexota bacterium]